MKYREQYKGQSYMAKSRGIDFCFTYDEWVAWWGDDIDKRGRSAGCLQMARYNDTGPYHPDNVYKATKEQNQQEYFDRVGYKRYQKKPKIISVYVTPEGSFPSRAQAAKHYGISPSSLGERQYWRPNMYYYLKWCELDTY